MEKGFEQVTQVFMSSVRVALETPAQPSVGSAPTSGRETQSQREKALTKFKK